MGACLLVGTPVYAEPTINVIEKTYKVDAVTAQDLTKQMSRRGPKGYWAYTRWDVRWTAACDVSATVIYTMPKHKNPANMPPDLRESWQSMLSSLRAHEVQHGQHGINAAHEVEQAGCSGGNAILGKWSRKDWDFDVRTAHGAKAGVTLP